MQFNYCLLISLLFFLSVSGDWFTDRLPFTCSTPRIRRSYSDLTYKERSLYIRLIYQLKLEKDAWKKGSTTKQALYDTFVEMHTNSRNAVWHYTSVFPAAHKAMLWLYESALIWVGVKYNMFSSNEEACSWGLPYWACETSYDYNPTDSDIPVLRASIFENADLNGDSSPQPLTYYVDTGYFSKPEWVLFKAVSSDIKAITSSKAPNYDKKLKRLINPSNIKMDPTQVMNFIVKTPKFVDFLPWNHGQAHLNIHNFLSFSMQTPAAPDDPMFFLHHANVDRLFHFWADCHEYDKIDASSLTNDQYVPINPIDANSPNPHPAKDSSGKLYDVSLESYVPLYISSTTQATYILSTEFPTIRELWTLGTPTKKGWAGLYYRYGPDSLASSSLASTCKPGNTWTWVNYGNNMKRSEDPLNYDDRLYQNLTATFDDLVNEGYSPMDALEKMAMDSCMSNPQEPLEDHNKKYLRMMGIELDQVKRICDKEEVNMTENDKEEKDMTENDHMAM